MGDIDGCFASLGADARSGGDAGHSIAVRSATHPPSTTARKRSGRPLIAARPA